ncbi:MAG: MFS transporter [Oscillospiraceae bacterium]|nr:MFS transporter [Oscillospiraceae bacterium]
MDDQRKKAVWVFTVVIALTGLGLGLSDSVFANFYKDAYDADAFQRGLIELPRETPGVICVLIVSALAFFGDIRLSMIAQTLSVIGLIALGLMTPSFGVMLVFLFTFSLGQHMFMPLSDSLGMSLAKEGGVGSALGRLNGVRTAFTMAAGILVFAGFKAGFFSFTAPVKSIFLIAAAAFAVVSVLLLYMRRLTGETTGRLKFRLILRKEYGIFYLLAALFGARKQIMFVYGPWVLIELLGFGADTMALLGIAGAAVGIFFMPAVGRWIDRYGTARIMTVEAAAFIVIYIAYGLLSAGLSSGRIAAAGLSVAIAFAVNMADRMTMQFGMVRAVYMRSVAVSPEEVTPTLSAGMALDHILSILSAVLCGWLWKWLGPQYVFVFAALLSVGNMAVARRIKD